MALSPGEFGSLSWALFGFAGAYLCAAPIMSVIKSDKHWSDLDFTVKLMITVMFVIGVYILYCSGFDIARSF